MLKSAKDLEQLQTISRNADFNSLTNAEGLKSLQTIGGIASFASLKSAEGLENLRTVNGEDATQVKNEINNRSSIRR